MSLVSKYPTIDHLLTAYSLPIDVLRLDVIHPVVSGNKWFKLKEYLRQAREEGKASILTFGGAYSNHIVATAAAAKMYGLKSIGVIRGEKPKISSHTLISAKEFGMQLFHVSRTAYKEKEIPREVYEDYERTEIFKIPEGGYGRLGMLGAKDILSQVNLSTYTHILAAVGTGTTLAGLIEAALSCQTIIGIPVLKNAFSLQQEIESLLPQSSHSTFELKWDYHFGGYAKTSNELIQFMNDFFVKTGIPTDYVYTAKAFYAVFDLFKRGFFSSDKKILLVHTGGLQGNLSLPKGTLIFG
jgi:1-aminocyclopropane-1-carboxylate deaminase